MGAGLAFKNDYGLNMEELEFPDNKKAAIAIVDDADLGNRANLFPIYQALEDHGMVATKTTFIYPSKRSDNQGHLFDDSYISWLLSLQSKGFEIGLHNVGDGIYTRDEICSGLERFTEIFGTPPKVHCNHWSNPDNLYWNASDRFSWPISWGYQLMGKDRRKKYWGDTEKSPFFWGDLCFKKIKYVRNLCFNQFNTRKVDPYMPYWDPQKKYVRFWFSCSDMRDINFFTKQFSPANLERLEKENGFCIAYTHFGTPGFLGSDNRPSTPFSKAIELIRSHSIWITTVSQLLDFLLAQDKSYYDCELTKWKGFIISIRWALDRIQKQYI